MKNIFLESHHINNLNFGFGQFNYNLLKAIAEVTNERDEGGGINNKFTILI